MQTFASEQMEGGDAAAAAAVAAAKVSFFPRDAPYTFTRGAGFDA